MNYIYRELKTFVNSLSEDQLDQEVRHTADGQSSISIVPVLHNDSVFKNPDMPGDIGTLRELKEVHKNDPDYDESKMVMITPVGTILFYQMPE